jgi:hypothetical protein
MDNEIKKVSWNASEGIIAEISNRRSMANTHFINGNLNRAFNTLISIKQSVIQSLTSEERVKLSIIEDKFNKCSIAISSVNFNNDINKIKGLAFNLVRKLYHEYNNLLMDLLEDRGYLIGGQQDASKMRF